MSRLLLGLVAVNCLVGGLALAGLATLAVSPGVAAAMAVPAFWPVLQDSAALAACAALPGAVLGLAAAAYLPQAGAGSRLAQAAAVLVLLIPVPLLAVLPASIVDLENAGGLGGAVARAAALMVLAVSGVANGEDPRLRRAALAAGASALQAWRHVVLAPVWRPAWLGALAGFLAALAQTRAGGMAEAGVSSGVAWHLPAGLLLAAFGAAALRTALRRVGRHDGMAQI